MLTQPFPSIAPHLPGWCLFSPKASFFDHPWFLVYLLPSIQAGKEREEIKMRSEYCSEISQKNPTLDFKLKEEYLKRACWNWFLNPQKAVLQSIQSATYFPALKSHFIQGRKCTSMFIMGRMFFFALSITGKISSQFSLEIQESRILKDLGSAWIWENIYFFLKKSLFTAIRGPYPDKNVSARLRHSTAKWSILAASSLLWC